MTADDADSATGRSRIDAAGLRIGGVFALAGAITFATVRLLHGDTPGADPVASLGFVAGRPHYAAVHIAAVFAALLGVAGMTALARSLATPAAQMWGRLGLTAATVGLGIFGVESTSEGFALPELAHAAATAAADQRAELVRAAHAVLAVTHGPSLIAIALLYGASLLALGVAIIGDDYPSWLGWAGTVIGSLTLAAATGQYMNPDLMPGFLIYGLLASILAQLWLIALAAVMLGRAKSRD